MTNLLISLVKSITSCKHINNNNRNSNTQRWWDTNQKQVPQHKQPCAKVEGRDRRDRRPGVPGYGRDSVPGWRRPWASPPRGALEPPSTRQRSSTRGSGCRAARTSCGTRAPRSSDCLRTSLRGWCRHRWAASPCPRCTGCCCPGTALGSPRTGRDREIVSVSLFLRLVAAKERLAAFSFLTVLMTSSSLEWNSQANLQTKHVFKIFVQTSVNILAWFTILHFILYR